MLESELHIKGKHNELLFKQSPWLGIRFFFFIALSLCLLVFDHRNDQLQRVRSLLMGVVAPIQYLVDRPLEWIDWAKTNFSSQHQLIAENANLKAESLYLRAEMQRILALKEENKNLRALLQSIPPMGEQFTIAQLLAVSIEPYVAQVVLNKGLKNHLYVGQPVLDAEGVMGQVVQVGERTSRVMLLTDVNSAIPVQVARTGMRAIAVGNGPGQDLSLINVKNTSDIRPGD